MDKKYADYLLKKTKQDYNKIAKDYARLRNFIPESFVNLIKKYCFSWERVLDLGCAQGRMYEIFKKCGADYFGVDFSEKLIKIAEERYPLVNFQVADGFNLPFGDNFFDRIFCFSVFHHIPSKETRIQFLKEAKRILNPGGVMILTVWNLNPLNSILIGEWKRFLTFLKYFFLKILGRTKLDFNDFFLNWGKSTSRYFHYFSQKELKKTVESAGFKIRKSGILKKEKNLKESNLFVVLEK